MFLVTKRIYFNFAEKPCSFKLIFIITIYLYLCDTVINNNKRSMYLITIITLERIQFEFRLQIISNKVQKIQT